MTDEAGTPPPEDAGSVLPELAESEVSDFWAGLGSYLEKVAQVDEVERRRQMEGDPED